jgi:MFS family permease
MGLLGTMSAVGTALGPTLGGLLIAAMGWRALFLANLPLGLLSLLLAWRFLPADRQAGKQAATGFDPLGTLLLALTLAAYALAMTLGRGHFGWLNLVLLAAAAGGLGLFVWAESRVAAPLIRLDLFRNPALSASLAMSALVATVMMSTLVVGPFYLARGLGLAAPLVGLALSVGPLVVAFTGLPAGRLADRWGAQRVSLLGLVAMALGALLLALLPTSLGVAGYVAAIAVLTGGYGLFQTANNTAVMADIAADQRGLVSGLLNLARNLGLVSGASLMGAVFSFACRADDISTAQPEALASGMHMTFAVAAGFVLAALAIAGVVRGLAARGARESLVVPATG